MNLPQEKKPVPNINISLIKLSNQKYFVTTTFSSGNITFLEGNNSIDRNDTHWISKPNHC